ncbi:protein of unknown function [Agreia sp. COWG]|nr:protein of unknown function [Agreia sp. COWG]
MIVFQGSSGALAQLVARFVRIEEVRSSNLLCSTRTAPRSPGSRRGFLLFSCRVHDDRRSSPW